MFLIIIHYFYYEFWIPDGLFDRIWPGEIIFSLFVFQKLKSKKYIYFEFLSSQNRESYVSKNFNFKKQMKNITVILIVYPYALVLL